MNELLVAAIVGLSFGNSYPCLLLIAGWTITDRNAGLMFVIGRTAGIFALGILVWAFGYSLNVQSERAIGTIFGISCIIFGTWFIIRCVRRHLNSASEHCPTLQRKTCKFNYKFTSLGIGILRGATPCVKVLILAPILLSSSFGFSMLVICVFALASAIYPFIAYLSSDILKTVIQKHKILEIIGAVVVIAVGVYYVLVSNVFPATQGE